MKSQESMCLGCNPTNSYPYLHELFQPTQTIPWKSSTGVLKRKVTSVAKLGLTHKLNVNICFIHEITCGITLPLPSSQH